MNVESQILMESGTNELEVLVFTIRDEKYGINIAKVREVITIPDLVTPPLAHKFIQGVFNLRGNIVPVINLRRVLDYEKIDQKTSDRIIITEFHQLWFGFMVDSVSNIYRISWKDIEPPSDEFNCELITGIAHIQEQLVLMLDVEKISYTVSPDIMTVADSSLGKDDLTHKRSQKKILIAEDSNAIRQMITNVLIRDGYEQLDICQNGEEAWDKVQRGNAYDLIITDIEMPRLDGLRLTKLVKSNERYSHIPIIIFSSIISKDNRNKGEAVGADEQISKPEIHRLIQTVDKFMKIAEQ